MAGSADQTATTNSDAQLAVEKFKAAGVQSVIPLLRENAFFPYIGAETSQQYYPQLLLSDYQSTIEVALGLIPVPYEQALNGQEGVTTETLGGIDDDRPQSQGGYDPGVRSCYTTWHAYHPKPIPGTLYHYIEEQGPIQAWCGAIRLFATAAKDAGKNLNRRTFVEAMSKITNYPGTLSPDVDLRAEQVLRPDPVPGREGAQQRAEVGALQNAEERQAAGHLLGDGAAVQAAARRLGLTTAGRRRRLRRSSSGWAAVPAGCRRSASRWRRRARGG